MLPTPRAIQLALILVSTLTPGSPPATASTASPPTLRWQSAEQFEGTVGSPTELGIARHRVVVAGTADDDALLFTYLARTGKTSWSRRFDSGESDRLTALVTTPRTTFVVGESSSMDVGQYHSDSFVLALRTSSGAQRWEAISDVEPGAFGESLADACITGDLLIVVGSFESKILVRALRQRTGRVVWEDMAPPGDAIDERASVVFARGRIVYVAGSRHTVGGRSMPYVVRAYDAATGERLWESQFGQQLSRPSGLEWIDGTLVLAGSYYDIGPGVTHWEMHGIHPASGELLWTRYPAGRSVSGSSSPGADALAASNDLVFTGGSLSRRRSLPVLRAYSPAGAPGWSTAAGSLRSGSVNALLLQGEVLVAAGSEQERGTADRRYTLRGLDAAGGTVMWNESFGLGAGSSAATALAAGNGMLAVAAEATASSGKPRWIVRLYDPD